MFVVLILFVLLIGWAIVLVDDAKADGVGSSRDGWEGPVSFTTDILCDSGLFIWRFGTLNRDTVRLYPTRDTGTHYDSSLLSGTGLSLDSIGDYGVLEYFWPKGSAVAILGLGEWHHEGPGRIAPASPSGSYICRVYGYLSDLGANYVSGAVVSAKLDQQRVYDTCAGMLVFIRETKATQTGINGYWYVDLTRSSCIGNQKYTFTVSKARHPDVTMKIAVPDSTTYYMTWGN
jgi:hypothetical protein